MYAVTALLALGLSSIANAHMLMRTPAPAWVVTNAPLLADGSDFPCKQVGGSATVPDTNKNTMAVGSSNTLSFTGGATHGGGSCQVSLAKGNTVSKDTKWMVIHSIEGGCPSDADGNLSGDPAGTNASKFQFTIPDHPDLPAGTYTLAWTWHNRIGNREMYMNCASVEITSAKKRRYAPSNMPVSKRADGPLPDMFVANIGNGCTTTEGTDVQYPNPGSSLEKGSKVKLGAPVGSCAVAGSSSDSSGSSSGSSASVSGSASTTSATANTVQPVVTSAAASASGALTQSAGGNFATLPAGGQASSASGSAVASATSAAAPSVQTSAAASAVASSAVAPVASAATSVAAPVATGTTSTGNGTSGSASGACTEGAWNCAADGQSFQRCASGSWSASMQVATGTKCSMAGGNFAIVASGSKAKRDLKSHLARRAHNIHQLNSS